MKAFIIALIAAGVVSVGSNPKLTQNKFKRKTINVNAFKMTGTRDVATGFPKTITTEKLWIKASGGGTSSGPFTPKTITVNKFEMKGSRGQATGFPKTITTEKLWIKRP